MTLFSRPGISLAPVLPQRRIQGLARADVPVLIGYATRGPAGDPVRIESLRQFQALFGPPMPGGHLTDAVKGFFETGGRAAYVLRLVGPGARVAAARNSPFWQITAQTPLAALGPLDAGGVAAEELLPWFDHLRRTHGPNLPDPGAWANDLTLTLSATARVRGLADVGPGPLLRPRSMAGLSPDVLLRLIGTDAIAHIVRVDAARGVVELTAPSGLADNTVAGFEVVAFDAEITQRGQRVEAFADLHPVPDHPNSVANRLNRQSQYLTLTCTAPDPDWTDVTLWPATGSFALSGGSADLAGLTEETWALALTAQARVDEIALVALPDLVRQPGPPRTKLRPGSTPLPDCDLPVARPRGALAGVVVDGATGAGVPGCQILAASDGGFAVTDADGYFYMTDLSPGLVDLRLSAPGFEAAETFLQSSTIAQKFRPKPVPLPVADPAFARIPLIAQDDVRTFDLKAVIRVQRAMPGLMGDYRVAVIDPPAPDMPPEQLLHWRAQLGDQARLFAVAPWLEVEQDGLIRQPPSGHICGAFAQAELAQGVHRAPANLVLRHVKQLTADLDEPALAAFHAVSLNAIRAVPGQGLRLMGSRSLSQNYDWQQVSVRRLFDAVEKTLAARLAWSVFEPGSATTRAILKFSVEQFLETLRRRGMFAGATAAESYAVACDGGNNTPSMAARGELVIDIAIAPTKPHEFIRFSLTAQADAIDVTEAA